MAIAEDRLPRQSEGDVNRSLRREEWARRNRDPAVDALLQEDAHYFLHQSVSTPCLSAIRKAEGIWIEDAAGRRYMDFHGNNVHHIGYGYPRLIAANKRSRETGNRPILKVTTRDLGSAVEVRVRDNGTGIASENRDKLFQPFFTTKPTGEGTGLGLSISYEIVTQQHGGTIEVDSEVGAFTEFTVRLPRKQHATTEGRAA